VRSSGFRRSSASSAERCSSESWTDCFPTCIRTPRRRGSEDIAPSNDAASAGHHSAQHPGGSSGGRRVRAAAHSAGTAADRIAHISSAIALAVGIGLQNFPEGTAVSLPLRRRASPSPFAVWGQLSAIVEPIAGVIGAGIVLLMLPILPYALAFAAAR